MRILHLYKDYAPVLGGIENHVKLLAERQAAAGHQVTVLVCSPDAATHIETVNGVRVIKAARLAHLASTPISLALPWRLSRERPDIAHLHFPYPVGELSQLVCGQARRVVVTYHSDVVRQKTLLRLYKPLMHLFLRRADRILPSTPNYLASSEVLQRYRDKCVVVPFGIDRRRFTDSSPIEALALRRRLGGGPLVLFVGVLRYYKGLQYLVEAMREVSATLVIVGEGPYGPALRDQVAALGLQKRVIFVGRVSDEELPLYYRAADLFVLPASERSEAFGLVQVEAMSSGLPVICTELGTGTSFVNQHNVSGLVAPPKAPGALSDALQRLLNDHDLRQRLARGAQERSAYFDADRMLSDIQAIYEDLVTRVSVPD